MTHIAARSLGSTVPIRYSTVLPTIVESAQQVDALRIMIPTSSRFVISSPSPTSPLFFGMRSPVHEITSPHTYGEDSSSPLPDLVFGNNHASILSNFTSTTSHSLAASNSNPSISRPLRFGCSDPLQITSSNRNTTSEVVSNVPTPSINNDAYTPFGALDPSQAPNFAPSALDQPSSTL